jgi:hypothetical protein
VDRAALLQMKGGSSVYSGRHPRRKHKPGEEVRNLTLLASDFDQSRYLRATDFGELGSEKRLKIKAVTKEIDVGERKETKAVLWFTTTDKGLMLNKTNLRVLQGAFGNVMDNWPDKIVVVFSAMVDFRGKMTPALRVKIPPPKDNYRAPPQKAKPTPKPPVDEEPDGFDDPESLDDDISDVR